MKMQNLNDKISNKNAVSAVSVAVRIRPENDKEKAKNAGICVELTAGKPQIKIVVNNVSKEYIYDHVFDEQTNQEVIYSSCIHNLIDGIFEGYNATVFVYGQTGSGKTYTMGTSSNIEPRMENSGIIPRAARHIFEEINRRKMNAIDAGHLEPTFEVCVQFIELYLDDIINLLRAKEQRMEAKGKGHLNGAKEPRNLPITIIEDTKNNETYLRGIHWKKVSNVQDLMDALKIGIKRRNTASTEMNQKSSRSHAIFTVQLNQTRVASMENQNGSSKTHDSQLENLHPKFHFVDLAGSEKLQETSAMEDRDKETKSINKGLLVLERVLSALGEGNIPPYRDSKLTRLLKDSLGGNSRTLMIACASPSAAEDRETSKTLEYAYFAKKIKKLVEVKRCLQIVTPKVELSIPNPQQSQQPLLGGPSPKDKAPLEKTSTKSKQNFRAHQRHRRVAVPLEQVQCCSSQIDAGIGIGWVNEAANNLNGFDMKTLQKSNLPPKNPMKENKFGTEELMNSKQMENEKNDKQKEQSYNKLMNPQFERENEENLEQIGDEAAQIVDGNEHDNGKTEEIENEVNQQSRKEVNVIYDGNANMKNGMPKAIRWTKMLFFFVLLLFIFLNIYVNIYFFYQQWIQKEFGSQFKFAIYIYFPLPLVNIKTS